MTDANLVLNRLGEDTRLAGFMKLRRDLALAAVGRLADRLGNADVGFVAEGIIRIAESNMCAAIREISVERGEDPRAFTLVAFGGAGPMHGCAVAQEIGIRRVVAPNYPGNFCALGLLTSDLRHELVRTHLTLLERADLHAIADRFGQMTREAHELLATEGVKTSERDLTCSIGMRYEGQAHELDVPIDPSSLDRITLGKQFVARYFDAWSHSPIGRPVEIVTLRVMAIGRAARLEMPKLSSSGRSLDQARTGRRPVYFAGTARETGIYDRAMLPPDVVLRGPAIVEEPGATTVIPPDWVGRIDDVGNIMMELR